MMRGNSGKRMMVAALIAAFCLVGMSSSADAFWGRHRGLHGHYRHHVGWSSYRSYGFYGNYGYGGYGYGSYRYRRPYAFYPSYYASSFYYTPSYYYAPTYYAPTYTPSYYVPSSIGCGCCSTSSWDGGYSAYGSTHSAAERRLSIASGAAATRMQIATSDQRARSGKIELKINVPEDARVTINDRLTATRGSERSYVVRGAKPENQYEFIVRAEVERNGQTTTKTKKVVLRAGQVSLLAFDLDAESKRTASVHQLVSTTLRLRVPDNAKVFLAGYEMKQKSGVRVFETTRLRAGEELDYTVRVTFEGDGEGESREKELTLVGGQTQEVNFDFAPQTRLAAR